MRQSLFVSIFLHAVVVVLAIFGLPEIRKAAIVAEVPMVVEVVPKAQATNRRVQFSKKEIPMYKSGPRYGASEALDLGATGNCGPFDVTLNG